MSQQSNILNQILQVLSSFVQRPQTQLGDDYWRSVSGAQTGPYSMHSLLQSTAISALGPLFGGIVNKLIIGDQFNRAGNFSSPLAGMLLPTNGGTYSGAFASMVQDSMRTAAYWSRQQNQNALKRDFYRSYFNTLYPNQSNAQIQQRIYGVQRNPIQAAGLIQAFADPSEVTRTMQGMQLAQAGVLQWSTRRNPLDTSAVTRANQLAAGISQLSQQAQRRAVLGQGESFGGFSGGAVAQLAGIIANASDQFGNVSGQQLASSIQRFKTKVRDTTRALQPLRDIFGQDIRSMVNAIQGFTGQNISQLSVSAVQNISTRIADIQRYAPGVSMGQLADMGGAMRRMLANNGIRGYAGLGAGVLGVEVAGMLIPGNTSYGMTPQQFQQGTLNAYASAQGSRGVDFMSMAYSLWRQRNRTGTIQQFRDRISQAQANGQDALTAARNLAGVSSNGQLLRGLQYSAYREAQMSGAFASSGIRQQWRQQRDIKELQLMQTGRWTRAQISAAMRQFSNPQVMAQLSRSGNVDQVRGLNQTSRRIINWAVSTDTNFLAGARRVSQIQQQQQFGRTMSTIRNTFKDMDATGGTGWNTFFNRFMTNNWGDQSAVYKMFAQQVYGQTDEARITARNTQLRSVLGQSGMQQALRYGFLGAGRSDSDYRQHLKTLTQADKSTQQYKQAQRYVLSAIAVGQDKKLKDLAASKQGQDAYNAFAAALMQADNQTDQTKRADAVLTARSNYRYRLNALNRRNALKQSTDQQFTLQTRKDMQTLLKAQSEGTVVNQQYFNTNKGRFKSIQSFSQYSRLRAKLGGSDTNSDLAGKLNSVLQRIANFLKQIAQKK